MAYLFDSKLSTKRYEITNIFNGSFYFLIFIVIDSHQRPLGEQYTDFKQYKKTGAPPPLPDGPIISRMTDRRLLLSWKPSVPLTPRYPVTYQVSCYIHQLILRVLN